jgi:Acetyltransferase (GNAT) domain/Helix-turn-helix domain
VELVLRLLAGETLAELARETRRPKRQLSAWRRRFLAGGEAYLDGRTDHHELEALKGAGAKLSVKVAKLEAENGMLARRIALLSNNHSRRAVPHLFCSEPYSRALEEPGVRPLYVEDWDAYVLVREGREGARPATGVRPLEALDPNCDVRAGLDALQRAGIATISLMTDPMWCPELSVLREAFDSCRAFRKHYLVDRGTEVSFRKRHRNRINQARRVGEVREISLAEHLERWLELYQLNVASRQIPQPFSRMYFERLACLAALRTIAVCVANEIVNMTLWFRHEDTFYFHDGASSVTGFQMSAAYAAFAHVIEEVADCRYVLLGGSAGFRDDRLDGLAVFKRGFSNASAVSYLCSASLNKMRPDEPT